MIRIVSGDLLSSTEDIIAHQVNCCGVMGAGVAKQIKERFPKAYQVYRKTCENYKGREDLILGQCQLVVCRNPSGGNALVANLFGQLDYGKGKRHTEDYVFMQCLMNLVVYANEVHASSIAMPYKIGCGLAGGDWESIYKIIAQELRGFEVTLYKKEN